MVKQKYILFLSIATLTSLALAVSSIFIFAPKVEKKKVDEIVLYSVENTNDSDPVIKIDTNPKNVEDVHLSITSSFSKNVKDKNIYSLYRYDSTKDYISYNIDKNTNCLTIKKKKAFSCPIILSVKIKDQPNICASLQIDCAKTLIEKASATVSKYFIDGEKMQLETFYPTYSETTLDQEENISEFDSVSEYVSKNNFEFVSLFDRPFIEYEKVDYYTYLDIQYSNYSQLKGAISDSVKDYFLKTLDFKNEDRAIFSSKKLSTLLTFKTNYSSGYVTDREIIDVLQFLENYNFNFQKGSYFQTVVSYSGKPIESVNHQVSIVDVDKIEVDENEIEF